MQKFIQIGQTAARDPITGEFLPSVPLFTEITPETERAQAETTRDAAAIFAQKMKQYIDGGGIVERRRENKKAHNRESGIK